MMKYLEKSKSCEIKCKKKSKINENNKNDDSNIILSQIKSIFNHYSNNTTYLTNKQYKLFLIEASLLDDKLLTPEYSDTLFYSFSYAKDSITFNSFYDLIMKLVSLKFPENSKINPNKTLFLFFDTYISPLIDIYQSAPKKISNKKDFYNNTNVNDELNFNDINHKLIISKISSLPLKEIIEENYLLFLKIYQKYFCFENLKISRTQKNHLSQRAFIKVMEDFNICPEYLNSVQIENIFNRIIDNRDFTENIMNDFINVDLCNNDGMWFTLFHFINGIYLIAIFNVMVNKYDENNAESIFEIFLNNNDSQAFQNIIKLIYNSSNLKNVMPEEIRKMQMKILNYKNKDSNYCFEDNNNYNSAEKENDDDNKIDSNNNNNENNDNKNIIKYKENNDKENIKNRTTTNSYYNNYKQSTIKSNKSANLLNYKLSNYEIINNKTFNKKNNNKNNKNKRSCIIDFSTKIDGNSNYFLSYVELAPMLLKKYKKQLISVYKYYSELYLETIFSIYMTHNGFINVIKDLNLLTTDNFQLDPNLPSHQKFLIQKKRANLLSFSAVNLIFSKFSSVHINSRSEKGKTGNKRINFMNFVYIILILSNKIFNPKFNSICFYDKLFSYDKLINTKFPIKYAYNFVAIYINPLYQNILPMIEDDSFNLNNFQILLENERLNYLAGIIIPLFVRILKSYNDNKEYIEYSQYFKFLSDFNIFPDFVQRTKMIKIFMNFIDDFDEVFLMSGNNKIISKIESCAFGILYIGIGGNDSIDVVGEGLEIKLLNFIQRIAQSDNLGKISILNLKNNLQKDFLNSFYEIQNYILGDNQDNIEECS